MKIIIDTDTLTDNITTIEASSEDASFPIENVQNDYTTDLYKANGVSSASVSAAVSKGSSVAVVNTNATSIEVQAGSGATYELESDDENSAEMTYAAAGSSGITVADNSNLDYATGNFFGGVLVTVTDYTPSAEVVLDTKHDGSNGRIFSIQTNGKLRLTINGNNYDSTVATGLTDGTQHFLSYSVTRETASVAGSVRFEVDGVTLGTAVSITAGAPATVSNAVAQYILGTASKREAGTASKFYSYNRALATAAEVLSLYQSGVATADQWGNQTNFVINTGFETDTTGWAADGNHSIARITTDHYAGSACAEITATGAGGTSSNRIRRSEATVLTAYKKYRMTYAVKSSGGNTALTVATSALTLRNATLDGTWQVFTDEWTVGATGTIVPIMFLGGAGSFLLDEVYIYPTGATLALEPAGIADAKWTDATTNSLHATYPTAGTTVNIIRSLESGYSFEDSSSYVTQVYNLPGSAGRFWADYPEIATPHIVRLLMSCADDETLYAGIIRAGNVEEFNEPLYGLEEDSNDYSVEKELNNGGMYFRKKNVVRTFSNIGIVDARANCHALKHNIFDAIGPKPLAMRLVHGNITDWEFVLFAKRLAPPKITHDAGPVNSRIQLSLKEVT